MAKRTHFLSSVVRYPHVSKSVNRMLDDGRLVRVPTERKNRLVVERAPLTPGAVGVE